MPHTLKDAGVSAMDKRSGGVGVYKGRFLILPSKTPTNIQIFMLL
jgi:hypothetical protein